MITKIEAVNYKCLKNVSQVLSRFQVIAGPNGAGKSTFLDVPYIAGVFAREGLDSLWQETRARSFEDITFYGQGPSFQLAVEAEVPERLRMPFANGTGVTMFKHVRYEIEIGYTGEHRADHPPRILAENLFLMPGSKEAARSELVQSELEFPSISLQKRRVIHTVSPSGWKKVASKTPKQNSQFNSETTAWKFQLRNPESKSAMSTLPEDERFACANWMKEELVQRVQKIALRSEHMASPSSPLKQRRFAVDGSNLPQVIQDLQNDGAAFQGWLDHLRTVFAIDTIKVHARDEDKALFLEVVFRTGLSVKSWELSDGTLRLLALTLLAYIPENGSTYLIEEPENGIHPQAIEAVFQSLSSVYEGQVLLATHSPVLVALVKPEQLLCFSKGPDDATDVIRGDRHPMLKNWQGETKLSHLFAAGILS